MKNQDINQLLELREFSVNGPPPPEDIVFRVEFQTIGSLGDYVMITGRPKAGKTKFLSGAMAAAVSKQEVFGMRIKLPENKCRVAHFDTEQGRRSHYNCLTLMLKLMNISEMPDHFKSYHLRQDAGPSIIKIIDHYLDRFPDTGCIFVDGLLDLISSFNDETTSKSVVNWLKKITEVNNILLIAVLHRSMSVNKSIGHLGSSADRAAQSVLVVDKNKETRQYVLKSEYLRDGDDFTPVAIHYNKDISTWEQTAYIEESKEQGTRNKGYTLPDMTPNINTRKLLDDYTHSEHVARIPLVFSAGPILTDLQINEQIGKVYEFGRNYSVKCKKILESESLIWKVPTGWTNTNQAKLFIME